MRGLEQRYGCPLGGSVGGFADLTLAPHERGQPGRRRSMDHGRQELCQHTFPTGLTRGHEAAPLVVNNTMYIVTPWPNLLYPLDLTKLGLP